MNLLEKYDEYLLNQLFESAKNDELVLILSPTLLNYIESIKHPISDKLRNSNSDRYKKFKITLLDIANGKNANGEDILDLVSFTQSNKAIENISKSLNITLTRGEEIDPNDLYRINSELIYNYNDIKLYNSNRTQTSLGKLINKLFPDQFKASGDPGNDIESFVNEFKALRSFVPTFELVKGEDIPYWYNENRYGNPKQGPLYGSCMRYSHCSSYLGFYVENPDKLSLLILKDPNDDAKIIGRAIVWKIDILDNVELEEPKYFMDRIYYTNEHLIEVFKKYAKDNNWIYKKKQNMDNDEDFIDSINGNVYKTIVIKNLKDPGMGHYPYMDTMKYFENGGGDISNDSDEINDYLELVDTSGGAEGAGYWSDYYDDYLDTENDYNVHWCEYGDDYRYDDDCFYSEYYSEMVANDYASDHGVYCDYSNTSDDWRLDGDYEEASNGETATKEYAQENWYWSDYSNEWEIDACWSEWHNTYIKYDDAVEVYLNPQQTDTDWRADDDESWFDWEHDNEKYDNDVTIEELEEYNGLNEEEEEEEEEEEYKTNIKNVKKRKLKKKEKNDTTELE